MSKEIPYAEYRKRALTISAEGVVMEKDRHERLLSPWGVYNTPIVSDVLGEESYNTIFADILPDSSIKDFLLTRKKETGKVFCLDVMGQGGFSYVTDVDGDIGITLVDFRSSYRKERNKKRNRDIIEGDVLQPEVWDKASSYIEEHDTRREKGFDIVTFRPVEGWDCVLPDSEEKLFMTYGSNQFTLYSEIVEQMISVLHPNGGMLLVENNRLYGNHEVIVESIKQRRQSLDISFSPPYMRVMKKAS